MYTVLVKEDFLLCKHVLAVQLGRAIRAAKSQRDEEGTERGGEGESCGLPRVEEVSITNEEFGKLLMNSASGEVLENL